MKFYERKTCCKMIDSLIGFDRLEKEKGIKCTPAQRCKMVEAMFSSAQNFDEASKQRSIAQYQIDTAWIDIRKPYYCIWPKIQEAFLNSSLDIPGEMIHLPIDPLLIRFSEKEAPTIRGVPVRSILTKELTVRTRVGSEQHERGLSVWIDMGETFFDEEMGLEAEVYTYAIFPLNKNTVDHQLSLMEGDRGKATPEHTLNTYLTDEEGEAIRAAVKTVVSLCLLGTDNDLVMPDVLNADLAKYKKTLNAKYVEKAHRRGKVGWHVGHDVEVSPHFRRPHFGIRWTGEGRKIPKLVPIKGSVIHKSKIETVPTGYEGVNDEG